MQDPRGEAFEERCLVTRNTQVAQPALRLGVGQREGARGGARVLVLLRHRQRLVATRGHAGREGKPQESTGCESDSLPQAHDRIQYRAGRAGKCPPVQRDRA